ncbi:MAG: chemotaxis protein CheX [Deltaproteobacteria bacterium]|nr:chemotaxis protein CheX [Deltaproteobacteria bacterium]
MSAAVATVVAPRVEPAAIADVLHAALAEILEVNAFELTEPCDPDVAPPDAIGASIAFRGPPSGTLYLWIEPAEARAYAATSLGLDEVEPAVLADAIAELANVVAGYVLSRLWSEVCIAIDHAVVGAARAGVPTPVVVMGEHGRIGVAMEVTGAAP